MLTLFLVFGLLPVFVFIELTIQQRLFKHSTEKIDMDKELYQQLLKSARSRSRGKIDAEWELYQQRWD